MTTVDDLLNLLILDKIDDSTFNGVSKTIGSPIVFGGQVLAQAINAAARTIGNGRVLHSMHSYFLEAGDLNQSITYNVNKVRDGGSFSVRRVTAHQKERTIFILSASFHKKEEGYEHQIEMKTDVKQPEDLLSWTDMRNEFGEALPKGLKAFLEVKRPVEFKPTRITNPLEPKDLPPNHSVWFRLKGDVKGLDLATNQQILTYISDYNILVPVLNPHASVANWENTQTASLDHSMWYYRDFDFSDWLLYSMESPSASKARGFARGNIFTRKGKLIASVAQEGLVRPVKK
ncbi:acyl-CoA thioesterase [Hyunsoonleella sp. 2307UL5-6]|uniref:acyl-CoA thioesterase n=1 Tax=Hyunsoonleella sp. 2307UL5-6 TaxID=3384768 RepID=UPI0039BD34A5